VPRNTGTDGEAGDFRKTSCVSELQVYQQCRGKCTGNGGPPGLAPSLHRGLALAAQREGVSLNQYINTVLAREAGRPQVAVRLAAGS
jgi:hypothetical protein